MEALKLKVCDSSVRMVNISCVSSFFVHFIVKIHISRIIYVQVGIMGGTGLDDPQILNNRVEKSVDTPFGKPSDVLIVGTIGDVDCVLLARFGLDLNYEDMCAGESECVEVSVRERGGSE